MKIGHFFLVQKWNNISKKKKIKKYFWQQVRTDKQISMEIFGGIVHKLFRMDTLFDKLEKVWQLFRAQNWR